MSKVPVTTTPTPTPTPPDDFLSFSRIRSRVALNPSWFLFGGIIIHPDGIEFLNLRREREKIACDPSTTEFYLDRIIVFDPLKYGVMYRYSKSITDEILINRNHKLTHINEFREALIRVKSDSVTINLSGHGIYNGTSGRFICPHMNGIFIDPAHSYVQIYNGEITGFNYGILSQYLSFSQFHDLRITSFITSGIRVASPIHLEINKCDLQRGIVYYSASIEWRRLYDALIENPADKTAIFNIKSEYQRRSKSRIPATNLHFTVSDAILHICGIDISILNTTDTSHHNMIEDTKITDIINAPIAGISLARLCGINISGVEVSSIRNIVIRNVRSTSPMTEMSTPTIEDTRVVSTLEIYGIFDSERRREVEMERIYISNSPGMQPRSVAEMGERTIHKRPRIVKSGCKCNKRA